MKASIAAASGLILRRAPQPIFIAIRTKTAPSGCFIGIQEQICACSLTELDRELIRQSRAFYFGSLGLIDEPLRSATLEAVRTAHTAGQMIVLTPITARRCGKVKLKLPVPCWMC